MDISAHVAQTVALDSMPSPEAVRALEDALLTMPQADVGTQMLVHGGMCARTIVIPADAVLTGAATNADNVCVMWGDVSVATDDGVVRLTGFHVLPAHKGIKRVGVSHAVTYWTTIWPTQLTDLKDIEDEMTGESSQLQTRRGGIEFASQLELEGV